jgi:hypothetical protein
VILLWERVLGSWSLAMDERGGHEDLRDSGCRSVIPCIHRRTELSCTSLPYLSLIFFRPRPAQTDLSAPPCEVVPARTFYSSWSGSYNESRGPTGGLELVKPYVIGHNGYE